MILDWKKIVWDIYEDLKNKISKFKIKPTLSVILVWDDSASITYVNQKQKYANLVWINFVLNKFPKNVSQNILFKKVIELNNDKKINWFIIQLPLPNKIDSQKIIESISPEKDVDSLTKENVAKLFFNQNWFIPSTVKWIEKLLDYYKIKVKWKHVVVIWKSNIVWKPTALLMINKWATVTNCDIYTKNLKFHTLNADIIISAAGKPKLIKKDMVKKWSILIDVWFNYLNWKICWDCDFENLEKDNFITPTPWWVWPLTVAMLLENTYLAFLKNKKIWKK
jgi:methylenetetrahydrofolate dehydrogenase (NADP+) / methenyltetrahydrofolate cyclohydrolase